MSTAGDRAYDARRAKAAPWRLWYKRKAWKLKAKAQLRLVPWCEPCRVEGRRVPATVANHRTPHRGDPWLFWHGPLESACVPCHNGMIQRAERAGFRPDVDADGWPSDPDHPFNRPRRKPK